MNYKKIKVVLMFSLCSLFVSQGTWAESSSVNPKEVLKPLKKDLMKSLSGKLKKDGPVAALKFCHLKAMPITKKHQNFKGTLGRTSHKLRNPKNAPKDWVKPYLAEFVSGKRKDSLTIKLEDGKHGYLEPIRINQPACLKCHGENISPKVQETLSQLYPKDQATGFKMGDFRGLFWVEY